MSVGRFTMRGRVFQARVFAPLALSGGGAAVISTDPKTGWKSAVHSRSLVSQSDMSVVAAKHSRVVVCFPEVRR
jgi:hypothetical protein